MIAPRPRHNAPIKDLQLEQEQDPELAGKVRPENLILPEEGLLHKALNPEANDPNRPEEILYRIILPDTNVTPGIRVSRQEVEAVE